MNRTSDNPYTDMPVRLELADYLAAPDPNYCYRLLSCHTGQGFTTYVLELESQCWLTEQEVERTLWKHWMTITKPDVVASATSLLAIKSGSNNGEPPKEANPTLVEIAIATSSVVSSVAMVPNQPLIFYEDGVPRYEDSLIAYCWDKYLRTGDRRWSVRVPMAKSVLRAMDTVTAFCAGPEAGELKIGSFVLAGQSKRGWTTWTAAAVDKRIVAIVPMVSDLLNIERSFIHHWESYGYYAPATGDYQAMGIMDWQGSPNYTDLMNFEEPYAYRDRFTMPKLIINATGDEFFVPDSSQFYFKDLPGIKYIRYVPNSDHGLIGTDVMETLLAFYKAIIDREPLPHISWKFQPDGAFVVEALPQPISVKLWQATNPQARDFRVETLGKVWTSKNLVPESDGSYVSKVEAPERGWTAYMVECTYAFKGRPEKMKLSTEVTIIPNIMPHEFRAPEK